jgi:hypothetical protein
MSRSSSGSRGERMRRRFGDDRAFIGAALGAAACFPTSLLVTGPLDREPTPAVILTVVCMEILLGIVLAVARPIPSDSAENRRTAQAGVHGH